MQIVAHLCRLVVIQPPELNAELHRENPRGSIRLQPLLKSAADAEAELAEKRQEDADAASEDQQTAHVHDGLLLVRDGLEGPEPLARHGFGRAPA